ncbi:hypothetical protein ACHAXR_007965, partial [Thalassiosira sp. AJA248-18]
MSTNAATTTTSSSTLRRSTRSLRSSPYFSSRGTSTSATSSYLFSSSVTDEAASDVANNSATEKIVKGSSNPKTKFPTKAKKQTRNKSSSTAQKSATKVVSPSPNNKKRRAKSPSKKGNKKAKTKSSSSPVERTRSFEPAWWGNVLTTDTQSLHSHATAATTTTTASSAPTPTPTTKTIVFPPVHTLILGTHPSIASLESNEMYGFPTNAFWYIAGDALGFRRSTAVSSSTGKPYVYFHDHLRYNNDQILEYPQQLERMVSKGFAMWDIIAECEREGSLDTDIQQEVANPIREFCEGGQHHLSIKRIVIANGTTGAKFFVKHYADWFLDGKLCAAPDEMSQRVFKSVMNKAKKANGSSMEEDIYNKRLIEVVCLPGVSPAAAKFTYLEKRDAWEKGCYGPGLADYSEWEKSRQDKGEDMSRTPELSKNEVTPSKRTKSKSPRKSASPSPSKMPPVRIFSSDLASIAPENEWIDLEVPAQELRPSATLTNGQCFNWLVVDMEPDAGDTASAANASPQKSSAWGTHDAKEWVGPLQNRVISIRETSTTTLFRVLHGPNATDSMKEELRHYFRLETPLAPLYKEWSKADARLAKIANAIPG